MSETTINQRLKKLLFLLDMNASEFSQQLNYKSPEKISRLIRDNDKETKPSYDIIKDIANSFENINIVWLITGKGEMLKSDSNIQKNKGTGNIIQNGNGNLSGAINIGGEMHSKKSIEERLKGMVHEIRNLRTQVDNLNKIIEEKERLIETKDQIIELLKSK